ncbi:scavenger receptor cysteine-rich domain superfamily protein-like [Acropora muricata]|uniref:scavenger receptor cysteine-rich domain superfamily protein-like n=1 Tax=Acropora muricata TaxID=159855 RepID=UPI0034E42451
MRTRQCENPKPQFGGKLCTGANATAMRGCTNISRCRQDFSFRFLTKKGFPSHGSMQILSKGTWKDLCITNWNDAERNLVCQAQGYNGSSPEVYSNSGTNSSGNTTHSCEQLTQNCEDKISREIKCSVPVRLAGLDSINYAGRVEVFYQGKWGKICRNKWDINDVKVVCRQLGFRSAVSEFIGMDTKDENISVVMSNVACIGQESVLASCKRFDEKHNCVDNIGAQAFCEPKNRTVLEKRSHVFNIGSNETVKCSKVETENISWHNGITGVKIKSGGRIELNGLSLKIKNFQPDDAGTYECRGESSTRFYTIYAIARFIRKTPEQAFISGGPGILRCSALGNPSPHFKWSRQDGRSLQDGRFIQLANGSLMMKSIQAEDKGHYICTIKQPRAPEPSIEKSQSINVIVVVDGGWSDWSQWSHCSKNIGGIQLRIRRCVNPDPQSDSKPCPGPDLTVIRGCTNISRCHEEFRVSFRTKIFYPSTGSMRIFNSGRWQDLCVANWDVVERNLVCQAQGYNRSSQGVHSKTGTSSLGNTTYSCEQFTQNCEEKINTDIKCSVPVRLAGIDGVNYAGRVEVFYQGKWNKICRNEWDINDVKVVCRQLGFQSAMGEFREMDTKDETISFAMSHVACTGQESVLASCRRRDGENWCSNKIGAQALCELKYKKVLEEKRYVFDPKSTATVNCSIEENFGQKFSWYDHTGSKIKSRGRIKLSGLYLEIKRVQLDDAGKYECRGISSSRNYTIVVASFPVVIVYPRRQTVIEGEPTVLTCIVQGVPLPAISWTFSNGELSPKATIRNLPGESNLTLSNTSKRMEGWYTCKANNEAGDAFSNSTLHVLENPTVTMSLKPHPSLIEGEQLTLICQANQATKEIQWTKDNVSVIPRANIQQIGSDSTLVIEKVLTSDSGKYSCKAVNKAGSASSSVDIRVTAKTTVQWYFIVGPLLVVAVLAFIVLCLRKRRIAGTYSTSDKCVCILSLSSH